MEFPAVTSGQMEEVDRILVEEYGFSVGQLMENAGYQVAEFVRQELDAREVQVCAGPGNNGGDGLVAARRLHLWGFDVSLVLASEGGEGLAADELERLEGLEVPVLEEMGEPDIVIDALIGYSLDGDPRPPFDRLIGEMNSSSATVVSVDIPSGVDADTGEERQPHVEADYTVTLALPFKGLERSDA
ncbi:MAG: NAD(P)H-hydrate epimerase, partial [Candidatus Nanohaloarchaea archaeon]|nr:NAD(P)H-hydrate epimerase [Candidatus Nanohaloarchaea archaeon]